MAFNMGKVDAVLELSAKVDGMSQLLMLERSISDVKNELNKYEHAQKASTAQSGLFNAATVALGGFMLDAAYKAAEFVKQSVALGFTFAQTENRMRMLAESYGEYDAVQALVSANADRLGVSQMEAAKAFTDVYGRLRPLGISLEEINGVYMGFNTVAAQSGVAGEEAAGAFFQLAQAMSSGSLRADDLNTVLGDMSGLYTTLAKEMNVPIGQIRKLASEGKITTDVLIAAFSNAAKDGGAQLDALAGSAANAGTRLGNAFKDFQASIGKELVPALAPLMDGLTKIVKIATDWLVPVARQVAENWQWFGRVLSEQITPVFKPLQDSVARLMGGLNITDIAKAWEGFVAIGVAGLTKALEFSVGVWTKIVDAIKWIADTPVFKFVADKIGEWVKYLGGVRDSVVAANDQFKLASPVIDAIGKALFAVVDLASRFFKPAIDGIVAGWRFLYDVMTQQVAPALQPIIDAVQRLVGDLDVAEIAELWAGRLTAAIQAVTGYIDYMGGLWRQLAKELYITEIIKFFREAWVGALDLIVDGITNVSKAWAFTLDVIKQLIDQSPFAWILKQMGLWKDSTYAVAKGWEKIPPYTGQAAADIDDARQNTNGLNDAAALTAEELKAQEEARKKLLEQMKEEQKYADAITDKQKAILSIQQDQAEKQREKYDGTEAEFAALIRIRDLKLKQAELDYKAEQARIRSQVALGQMTDREAQVRLEILKIQYDSTKATINQAHEQEVLNERAERLKALTQETVVETVTLTEKTEQYTAEIERATTHVIKLHGELREVDAAVVRISRGWMSVQNETLLAAEAAYNYEQFIKSTAERIADLRAEGTQASNSLASALLANLNDQQLNAVRDQFMSSGLYGDGSVIRRMATGGYVTGPTMALIGEGSEPEYVIPASRMGAAAGAFLSGARGPAVLQPTSAAPVTVSIQTGPVVNMGGEQYVRKTDMSQAVNQAVAQVVQLLSGNTGIRQMVGI